MTKARLELFSDGVFVIVLTLLVLDLKPPAADGPGWADRDRRRRWRSTRSPS